ncbi:MAG: T9SS type A sorting domain-containing protein [Ignavibacteria bacterium]
MKTLIQILILFFGINTICYSQLPSNYPFKAIIDSHGDIYVAGDTLNPSNNTFEFVVKKYINGILRWRYLVMNPNGDDRGMDLVVYEGVNSYVYATGYINNASGNQILTVKLRSEDGTIVWSKEHSYPDCKGFAIALDLQSNPYITGYLKTELMRKFITSKYSNNSGTILWTRTYSNRLSLGNDAGTDILLDSSYVYVIGQTYNGPDLGNDIVLLNYNLNGDSLEVNMYNKYKSNETPTSFVISSLANKGDKSRISLTSISDATGIGMLPMSSYTTIAFKGGEHLDLHWARTFKRTPGGQNFATSLDADAGGNLYVTGYSQSGVSGFDYATIKYTPEGNYGWQGKDTVVFYDMGSGNDKASSIKVFHDSIYVTGSSELTPGGYKTVAYAQGNDGTVKYLWDRTFIPSFADERGDVETAATLNIDTVTGNLIVMAMVWGENAESKYAIQAISPKGDILYTIDNDAQSDNNIIKNEPGKEINNLTNGLSQNYPNPFNPTTRISYGLRNTDLVSIKVYTVLGDEVATLINEIQQPGSHSVTFNGTDLSSGIYYYKIKSGNFEEVKRMILIK